VDKNSGNGKDLYKKHSAVAFAGMLVAVVACIAAMLAGLGSRIGFWHFRTGEILVAQDAWLCCRSCVGVDAIMSEKTDFCWRFPG
jgi:hypothetical protein